MLFKDVKTFRVWLEFGIDVFFIYFTRFLALMVNFTAGWRPWADGLILVINEQFFMQILVVGGQGIYLHGSNLTFILSDLIHQVFEIVVSGCVSNLSDCLCHLFGLPL